MNLKKWQARRKAYLLAAAAAGVLALGMPAMVVSVGVQALPLAQATLTAGAPGWTLAGLAVTGGLIVVTAWGMTWTMGRTCAGWLARARAVV
ncbi:MAG: hypothetical protein M0Z41_16145 [Peptococcaceae bacterium]|nr:hypothetical protein [Peptococcaceae bacterium]